jgi:hypothetical protein
MLAAEAPEDFPGAEVDDDEQSTVLGDLFPETAHTEEEEAGLIVSLYPSSSKLQTKAARSSSQNQATYCHHVFLAICGKKDGENHRLYEL